VITDDDDLALRVRLMGAHGSPTKYQHAQFGFNSRLDTLQAVVLSAKLRRLRQWNVERRRAAAVYATLLGNEPGVRLPVTLPGNEHVWHLYVIRLPARDEVLRFTHEHGVSTGVHYPVPVHLSQAMSEFGHGKGSLRVSERAAGEILSLPIFPGITMRQQERVADVVRAALRCVCDERGSGSTQADTGHERG
jgi:dTDP-4-amino-4,6-dideoxygalactose transaminase